MRARRPVPGAVGPGAVGFRTVGFRTVEFHAVGSPALVGWELSCNPCGRRAEAVALLVHGTGLNGLSWWPVARHLSAGGWRAIALDMRGHGASERSADGLYGWDRFADDVARACEAVTAMYEGERLVGVGHSAGATALLMADALYPGPLCCMWAFEPIMTVPGGNLREMRSPQLAERARRRRATFASREEAMEHFRGRGAFAEFDDEALAAYVEGGTIADGEGGFRLACRPEDEARVYEGAGGHDAWPLLTRVRAPVRLVGGAASPAVPPGDLQAIAARAGAGAPLVVDGVGHFGPFSKPALVAEDILAFGRTARCTGG